MAATTEEIARNLGPLMQSLGREFGAPVPDDLLHDLIADAVNPSHGGPETGSVGFGGGRMETVIGIIINIVVSAFSPEIADGREAIEKALRDLPAHAEQIIESAKKYLGEDVPEDEIDAAVRRAIDDVFNRRREP